MEINEKSLNEVAGGKIVETKCGKFLAVPHWVKEYATEEEAKKEHCGKGHGHHHKGDGKCSPGCDMKPAVETPPIPKV